jgi:hypothetical protein
VTIYRDKWRLEILWGRSSVLVILDRQCPDFSRVGSFSELYDSHKEKADGVREQRCRHEGRAGWFL